jgi:hypothetical protein
MMTIITMSTPGMGTTSTVISGREVFYRTCLIENHPRYVPSIRHLCIATNKYQLRRLSGCFLTQPFVKVWNSYGVKVRRKLTFIFETTYLEKGGRGNEENTDSLTLGNNQRMLNVYGVQKES